MKITMHRLRKYGNVSIFIQLLQTDFFDFITPLLSEEVTTLTFNDLQLSRPVLKALEAMGYKTPTPIQVPANVICNL